jgi:hypothetical protein
MMKPVNALGQWSQPCMTLHESRTCDEGCMTIKNFFMFPADVLI